MATTATNKQPLLVDRVFHTLVDGQGLTSGSDTAIGVEGNNSSKVLVNCSTNDGGVVEDLYTLSRTTSATAYTVLLFFSPVIDYLRTDDALYVGQMESSTTGGTRLSSSDLPKILAPVPHVGDAQFKALYIPRGMNLWCTLQVAGPVATTDTPIIGAQGGFY